MQFHPKDYDPAEHDRWRALTVKQPYADNLITKSAEIDGVTYAVKRIEVRSRPTQYRGDLMICASRTPDTRDFPQLEAGYPTGCTMGLVELYDCKPVSEFTEQDWRNTRIPEARRAQIKAGYGWFMRNPRRVIEHPVKGQLGIFTLVYTKDVIQQYPQYYNEMLKKEYRKHE